MPNTLAPSPLTTTHRSLLGTRDSCPPGSFQPTEEASEAVSGNEKSQGKNFVNTLKSFRGGSDNYYERTLRTMTTYYCVHSSAKGEDFLSERCPPEELEVNNTALDEASCNPYNHCSGRRCEVPGGAHAP